MSETRAAGAKEKLIGAAVELFRRNGFVATTVDEICAQAGVTKGAFFHYFESKEALAETCLKAWDGRAGEMEQAAPFQAIKDPLKRLLACMDFYIQFFANPKLLKSCLAGTIVQEVSESSPALRDAAGLCFANAEQRFRALLDEACRAERTRLDTRSLAQLWMATLQGSLILCKASQDESVLSRNLQQVREYIRLLFAGRSQP